MNDKFLRGFRTLRLPILDEHKRSAWPERFSLSKIQELKNRVGPHAFATQMMLERPDQKTKAFFNTEGLDFYTETLQYKEANRKASLTLGKKQLISGIAYWDPALGKDKRDKSVLACVFQDNAGFYYLHHIAYLNVERNSHAAQEQCDAVIEILKENYLNTLVIETNGIGGFLPELFRTRAQLARYPVALRPLHSSTAKNERILSTLDPILGAGFLKCHHHVKQSPLMQEFKTWSPEKKHSQDDGLDALSGAIAAEPVRIRKTMHPLQKRKQW